MITKNIKAKKAKPYYAAVEVVDGIKHVAFSTSMAKACGNSYSLAAIHQVKK